MRNTLSFCSALLVSGLLLTPVVRAEMSAQDIRATKDRISADYKAARSTCDTMSGNAKDICVEEAKGKEKVALAELQFARSGSVGDQQKVANAKADAAYEVAKERCDDLSGNAKDVCRKEAKAAEVRAKADAKVARESSDLRKDAADDKREASYKAAAEKCDAHSGEAKSQCINAAKAMHGKS